MSSDNPIFAPRHPYQQPMPSPPPPSGSGKTILTVLAIMAVVGLAMCCGVGTLAWYAIDGASQPQVSVELPERSGVFARDAIRFNESLAKIPADPCDDSGVCEFMRRSITAANDGGTVDFSPDMFIQAVAKSELSGGQLNITDRISLRSWIRESPPEPDTEEFYRILGVELEANGTLARVDLLFYSSDDQAESYQWFLAKENARWELYDWQRLEYGRRMSDEYAGYIAGSVARADGYDEVLAEFVEINEQWQAGEQDAARAALRACEKTRMLPGDLPVAQLRIAFMWLSWSENEEAIRVLESIQSPDQRWGVWPVLAMAYMNLDQDEKALEIAKRAEQQSPQHPNVQWLFSEIYAGLGQLEKSADASAKALKICPQDTTLFYNVTSQDRPQDIPLLLDVLRDYPTDTGWQQVLTQAANSTSWAQGLVEQLAGREDLPAGIVDLAAGDLAWSQEDYDTAATYFLAAKRSAELPYLKDLAATDHQSARVENGRFAELFAESDDLDATLRELVLWAYDDELYTDTQQLLVALQQPDLRRVPWADGLRGWTFMDLQQPEPAIESFVTFADWLKANPDVLGEDDSWVADTADYYIADALLRLQRPLDVLKRFPNELERHEQITTVLLTVQERATLDGFLAGTAGTDVDSVGLLRLQLQAELAFRDGDAKRCDELHRQAIEVGLAVADEQHPYLVNRLQYRRARDLIWNRGLDAETDLFDKEPLDADEERKNLFLYQLAMHAGTTKDEVAMRTCLALAQKQGIQDDETIADLQAEIGNLLLESGQYAAAIDPLRLALKHTDTSMDWQLDGRREQLLLALLRAERFEETRQLIQEYPPEPSAGVSADAMVAFAAGDVSTLKKLVKEFDAPQKLAFADWIVDHQQQDWYTRLAGQASMEDVLAELTPYVGYESYAATGTLLFDPAVEIEEASLRKALQDAFRQSFRLQSIPQRNATADSQAWLAESPDGQRLALHSYIAECTHRGLSDENAVALLDQVRALGIVVLDTRPDPTKRLFSLAASAAGDQANAFFYEQSDWLWTQPKLQQQLQVNDRVPVGPGVIGGANVSIEIKADDSESSEYLSIQEWGTRLGTAGGSMKVNLSLNCDSIQESIECELFRIDIDDYRFFFRPTADSQLKPWIREGRTYSTTLGYLSPLN